jgi:hypothetical protein
LNIRIDNQTSNKTASLSPPKKKQLRVVTPQKDSPSSSAKKYQSDSFIDENDA